MDEQKFKELTSNIPYWIMRTLNDDKETNRLGYGFMHEGRAYGLDINITITKIKQNAEKL